MRRTGIFADPLADVLFARCYLLAATYDTKGTLHCRRFCRLSPRIGGEHAQFKVEHSLFANSEYDVTKPQDIVVALKLCLSGVDQSFAALASGLGMSASEVHGACARLIEARLIDAETRRPRRKVLQEFLRSGVPYAFPAQLGEITRGVPTAWAAPVMAGKVSVDETLTPVWPDPDGTKQGTAVEPLYRSVPVAAKNDPELYDLLALVDALRLGRARERKFAEQELERRLSHEPAASSRSAANG